MIFPFYLFVYFCDFGTATATGFPVKRTPKISSITEVLVRKGVIRRLCRPELMIFLARRYHPVAASPVPYVGTLSRRVPSRASPTCRWDPPNHSRSYVQYSSPSPVSVYEIIHRCSTRAGGCMYWVQLRGRRRIAPRMNAVTATNPHSQNRHHHYPLLSYILLPKSTKPYMLSTLEAVTVLHYNLTQNRRYT
jgi:hypothetical protein